MTQNIKKIGKFYVLYHPGFGYLLFDRRSCEARVTLDPRPRALYTELRHAEARKKENVWIAGKRFPGSEMEIRTINISYEIAEG